MIILSTAFVFVRVMRLASCYHFWLCINKEKEQLVFTKHPQRHFLFVRKASKESDYAAIPEEDERQVDSSIEVTVTSIQELARAVPAPSFSALDCKGEREWVLDKKFVHRSCLDRLRDVVCDLLKVPLAPLSCLALECSASFVTFCSPKNGRKLYQSFEQFQFEGKCPAAFFSSGWSHGNIPEQDHRLPPEHLTMS